MLTGILALVEYSDPTAQNIELSVSDRIPVKFKVAFTSKGLDHGFSIPVKPKANPNAIPFVTRCLNAGVASIATHNATGELRSAVTPNDKYWIPDRRASLVLLEFMAVPNMTASFHCFHPIWSRLCRYFVEVKYCKQYDSRNCKADSIGEQWRKNVYNFFDGKKT